MFIINHLDYRILILATCFCITFHAHTHKHTDRLVLYNTILEINEDIHTNHIFTIIELTDKNIRNEQVMLEQTNLSTSEKTNLHALYLDLKEINHINKITLTNIGFKQTKDKLNYKTTHKRRPKHNIIRGKKGNQHKTPYDSTHKKIRKQKIRTIRSFAPKDYTHREDLTILNLGPIGNLFGLASSKNLNDIRSSIKDFNKHMNNIITNTRQTLVDLQKEAVFNHKMTEILNIKLRNINYFNTHILRAKIIIDAITNIVQNIKQSIQFNQLGIPNHNIFTNIKHDIESTTKKSGHSPIFDHTNITLINQIEGGFTLQKNQTYIRQTISIPLYALDHDCTIMRNHSTSTSYTAICNNLIANISATDCHTIINSKKVSFNLCYSRPCLLKNNSPIECLEIDSNHYIIKTHVPFACRINNIATDEIGNRVVTSDKFQIFTGSKLLFLPNNKELICNALKIDYFHSNITYNHAQSILWDWNNISTQNLSTLSYTLPNNTFDIIQKHIEQTIGNIREENDISKHISYDSNTNIWILSNGLSGLALLIITLFIIHKLKKKCSCNKKNLHINVNHTTNQHQPIKTNNDTAISNQKKHSLFDMFFRKKSSKNTDNTTQQEHTPNSTSNTTNTKLQKHNISNQKNVAIDSNQTKTLSNTQTQSNTNKQEPNYDNISNNSFHTKNIFIIDDDNEDTSPVHTQKSSDKNNDTEIIKSPYP